MLWLLDLYKGTGLTDVEMKVLRGNGVGNIVDQYLHRRWLSVSDLWATLSSIGTVLPSGNNHCLGDLLQNLPVRSIVLLVQPFRLLRI